MKELKKKEKKERSGKHTNEGRGEENFLFLMVGVIQDRGSAF